MSFQSGQGIPIVSEATKVAFAMPNGILFGLGYGTAIRVGYEILYPLLFPKSPDSTKSLTNSQQEVLSQMKTMYSTFGGLGAHDAGLEQGIKNAINSLGGAIDNPEVQQQLLKISSILAGTQVQPTVSPPSTFGKTTETFTPSFPTATKSVVTPKTSTRKTLRYSYIHTSGTSKRKILILTRNETEATHHRNILALWKQGKSLLNERGIPRTVATAKMNKAIAYSHAYNKAYQKFFVGLN